MGASDQPRDEARALALTGVSRALAFHRPSGSEIRRISLAHEGPISLGALRIEPALRRVAHDDGREETVEPRVMQVLVALVRAEGRIVSRDDLMMSCWHGVVVGEDAITRVMGRLRRLADGIGDGDFRIETITKVGYRLLSMQQPMKSGTSTPPTDDCRLSICVLPFANMSDDPQQEYFSDGISEDIITDLSKVSALSVVARNTAFTFKGKAVDVPTVAHQLNVSHVLEGSVRKAGNRVRITAQLVNGAAGDHIWAERWDRDLSDIFALQDEIAGAIVAALRLRLAPEEAEAIGRRSTQNPEAYRLYLMARRFSVMGSSRHQKLTVRLCRRALELDPDYARAWALLAIAWSMLNITSEEHGDSGWEAAERALALDPDLSDAHAAKGRILSGQGRYDDAVVEFAEALRLDPESFEANVAAGWCAMAMGRDDEAIAYLEKAAQVFKADFRALGMATTAYQARGDMAGARDAARRALKRIEAVLAIEPDHGSALGFGVASLVYLGEIDRAMEWAELALLVDPDNRNLRYNVACAMANAGRSQRALDLLASVIEGEGPDGLRHIKIDHDLDSLRGEARYIEMIAQADARLAARSELG